MTTCKLWKITLSCLYPQGDPVEKIFWGYHVSESQARDAALRWAANENGGSSIDTIAKVDLIP